MSRLNFTKKVQIEIIKRATRDGVVFCEACGALCKRWQIDHIIADALIVDRPERYLAEHGQLLCLPCHAEKTTKQDQPAISRAKRREARHLGVKKTGPKIKSRGFETQRRPPRIVKQSLPPKSIYEER